MYVNEFICPKTHEIYIKNAKYFIPTQKYMNISILIYAFILKKVMKCEFITQI